MRLSPSDTDLQPPGLAPYPQEGRNGSNNTPAFRHFPREVMFGVACESTAKERDWGWPLGADLYPVPSKLGDMRQPDLMLC